jgi:hypothetical protein
VLIVEKLFVTSYSDFFKKIISAAFYRGAENILNSTDSGV